MAESVVLHSIRKSRCEAMLKNLTTRRGLRLRLYLSRYLPPFLSSFLSVGNPSAGKRAGCSPIVPVGGVQAQYPAGTN